MTKLPTKAQALAAIERADKTTPGPWWYDTYNTIFRGSEQTHDLLEICSIPDEPETGESEPVTRDRYYPESANNAEFIVASRTDVLTFAQAYMEMAETLSETIKAVMHVSGPSHPLALKVSEMLAAYHAQKGGDAK